MRLLLGLFKKACIILSVYPALEFNPVSNISLPAYETYTLQNGIPIVEISGGTQDVLKLEILFQSGRLNETAKTASRTVGSLLKEGCKGYTSEQLAELFEYYGATITTSSDMDFTRITMYSLTKYFEKLAPVVFSIINEPSFVEEEINLFKNNVAQKLEIDLSKNDVLAYRSFTEKLYGKEHPYGYNSTATNYLELTRHKLYEEFDSNFGKERCRIFLSGKIDDKIRKQLDQSIGQYDKTATQKLKDFYLEGQDNMQINLPSPNPYQAAIRIGCRLFTRHHQDYVGMSFLTTLLGGYFGSRLMSNIREDKGYTYNIYSSIDNLLYDSYFYICTEVDKKHVSATMQEIKFEMNRLKTEEIPQDELNMVKNYISGNYLNELDGPLKSSRILRSLISANLDASYFERAIAEIQNITAEELRKLAEKYLNPKE